ncbi:MAG TPA: hypothetical protein VGN16_10715 [Acidobacteriaceae bacterium]|jgi:cytochrome c5
MRPKVILLSLLLSTPLSLPAQANAGQTPPPARKAGAQAPHTGTPDRGQVVFNTNCSRCHNAPEGFSSRISGTIAKHMRVRANLSEKDYQALMHFLNP